MLFFVSVGMLFDPMVLVDRPLQVVAVTAIIMIGKSLAAAALVLALRYPLNTRADGVGQPGADRRVLVHPGRLGTGLGVLPAEAQSLVVAGALLSIALNPLLFSLIEPLRRWVLARSATARRLEARDDPLAELPQSTDRRFLAKQVVLVGHGRVGARIAAALGERDIPFVVVDRQRERVQALRSAGVQAVSGDAADPLVLVQAHIADAGLLVVAASDSTDVRPIIATARALNPGIPVVVRASSADEAELLRSDGASKAVDATTAMASVMVRDVLDLVAVEQRPVAAAAS